MNPAPLRCLRKHRGQRGAALLLILILAMTVGLSLLFGRSAPDAGRFSRDEASDTALGQAKAALIGYALTYRDRLPSEGFGYLPCPDTNNDGIAEPNCGTADQTIFGRLPYKTLGLPELRSRDGECLWYAVSGSHKNNPKSANPLNWDTRGLITVNDAAGNALAAPGDPTGGAIALIVAPGAPLAAQTRPGGSLACSGDSTNAVAAYLDGGYAEATSGALTFVTGSIESATNNDRAVWIAPGEVFAPLAKRSDLLGSLMTQLTTCLNNTGSNHIPVTRSDGGSKWVATATGIDEVRTALACTLDPTVIQAWSNWKDHIHYAVCKSSSTSCLTVNGSSCSGVLLFGGRMSSGNPRTTAEKLVLANYFDSGNASALTGAATTFDSTIPAASAYTATSPDADIAICLTPAAASALSFQTDIGTLSQTAMDFGTDGSLVRVDTAANTLVLGQQNLDTNVTSTGNLFGCSWFGNTVAFGGGIRAYFRYEILNRGEGLVFVLADADRNPGTTMCGAGGMHMGYSGVAGKTNPADATVATLGGVAVAPILYPKIGLELDTRQQTGFTDPPTLTTTGRNDLTSTSHAAIVFWGHHSANAGLPAVTAADWDDNVHGLPATGNVQTPYVSPQNPAFGPTDGSDGLRSLGIVDDTGVGRHVRLEIDRTAISGGHRYVIRAWVASILDNLDVTTTAYSGSLTPSLTVTRDIFDLAPGTEALRQLRVGFTNSVGLSDQEIRITNFVLTNIP